MRIALHHTHAYPGCRATVTDTADATAVEAEFSDGVRVPAHVLHAAAGAMTVAIDACRTARGTAIPARRWLLRRVAGEDWKVVRRAEAQR